MAVTLLFVHGTGVRQKGYERSLDAIRVGCAANGMGDVRLGKCPWGEKLGVPTDLIDETLPPAARAAFAGPPTLEDQAAAEWQLLLEDPLFELRVAGNTASSD